MTPSPTAPATGSPDRETPKAGLRYFHVGAGFHLVQMSEELSTYTDVLLGRLEPPIDLGPMTLMECAEAYHARASEMEMEILEMEATGAVLKGSAAYRFRTGKLRTFIEMSKRAMDLGSRRLTYEQMLRDEKG